MTNVIKTKRKPTGAAAMGPGPGRPPGLPNKTTVELKGMILAALDHAGGVEYLVKCAKDPKTAAAFLTLIGKVLPMTIAGAGANGEHVIVRVERVVIDANKAEQA